MDIYSFQVKGTQIDITFKKGFIAYAFELEGKSYGQKIRLTNRSTMEAVSATALLIINSFETMEALKKNAI